VERVRGETPDVDDTLSLSSLPVRELTYRRAAQLSPPSLHTPSTVLAIAQSCTKLSPYPPLCIPPSLSPSSVCSYNSILIPLALSLWRGFIYASLRWTVYVCRLCMRQNQNAKRCIFVCVDSAGLCSGVCPCSPSV